MSDNQLFAEKYGSYKLLVRLDTIADSSANSSANSLNVAFAS
jgi:hypothetical protein